MVDMVQSLSRSALSLSPLVPLPALVDRLVVSRAEGELISLR